MSDKEWALGCREFTFSSEVDMDDFGWGSGVSVTMLGVVVIL